MATVNKDVIDMLNDLIETCRDGSQGFETAAQHVRDSQLKTLFSRYAKQRQQFAADLEAEANRLGGSAERRGSVAGALHRGWMNLKTAVSANDDAAIVAECERGEDAAKKAYEDVIKADLPMAIKSVVQRQYTQVKDAHDSVRAIEKSVARR